MKKQRLLVRVMLDEFEKDKFVHPFPHLYKFLDTLSVSQIRTARKIFGSLMFHLDVEEMQRPGARKPELYLLDARKRK